MQSFKTTFRCSSLSVSQKEAILQIYFHWLVEDMTIIYNFMVWFKTETEWRHFYTSTRLLWSSSV